MQINISKNKNNIIKYLELFNSKRFGSEILKDRQNVNFFLQFKLLCKEGKKN